MLPSAPTQVHITNVESEFALLHWSPPKTLGDTVTSYNVHIRPVNSENEEEDDEDEPEFKVNEQWKIYYQFYFYLLKFYFYLPTLLCF